ncbi:MAG: futalosine hydrolase [Halobacteriales archaeon]
MELLVTATRDEVAGFVEERDRVDEILGRPVYGEGPRTVVSGVGRTNAAAEVALALERYEVSRVVSCGVAGALPGSSLEVGDIVVGTHAVHGDLGVATPDGFGGTEHLGFETTEGYYNAYPLEPLGIEAESGGIATVATVSATDESAREVAERTDAIVETMETVAVAQVARLCGVPASAVVGVSNHAGEKRDFDFEAGAEALHGALAEVYA